ncbi:MAG: hypothetical protein WD053_11580, partial [Gracilimonas sp.]
MEVVQLMALLFAHINFQIRRGFRSRIFFGLKIPFSFSSLLVKPGYDALRRNQYAPTQSVWSEVKKHRTSGAKQDQYFRGQSIFSTIN